MARRSLGYVNVARRMGIGAVLAIVLGCLAVAVTGAFAATAGAELPRGLGAALSFAGDALGWLRLVVLAVLVYGVLQVREDG